MSSVWRARNISAGGIAFIENDLRDTDYEYVISKENRTVSLGKFYNGISCEIEFEKPLSVPTWLLNGWLDIPFNVKYDALLTECDLPDELREIMERAKVECE